METIFKAIIKTPSTINGEEITIISQNNSYTLTYLYNTLPNLSQNEAKEEYYNAVHTIEKQLVQNGENPDELTIQITKNSIGI